ncbi:MAG: CRTAC1 family protein [Acidobacteria bacterium]|nr:CRTAC1 family protein [Acidobacteriota bacterium]
MDTLVFSSRSRWDRGGAPRRRRAAWLLLWLGLYGPVLGSGGTVEPGVAPGPQFVDVTRSAGIDFHLTCGGPQKLYIMDSMCGGAAFLDYDNDGWPDILLVNGSTLDDLRGNTSPASKFYHNNGDGTFTEVTEKAGLTHRGWCMGVAAGDYDNDGWPDIYITCLTGAVLYRNQGDGTFRDVTAQSGAGNPGRWGTSAAFADYDKDGFLDLYVANYVDLDLNHLPEFGSTALCQYRGIPVSCGPRGLPGSRDRLYHNNGDGTFTDVTEPMGIDPGAFYGLGVVWADFDNDGWPDVYVANDSMPSLLYHNNGGQSFTEVGLPAGVALSMDGREQAGMGVDFGDYDNDGWPDLVKTNFSDDTNNLYHNNRDGTFEDRGGPAGFAAISTPFLGFGARFFDYDNDGWKDILIANGHVNPQVDGHRFGVTYAQRALLFHNLRNGQFEELGLRAGAALKPLRVSRGLAVADFDNDGALDVLMTNLDAGPVLLRNTGRDRGHWIRVKLLGTKSNRDGFGAHVQVVAGSLTQTDEARANASYLSASDPRLHFGLGGASRAERIVIRWPSGTVDNIENEAADQEIVVREGAGVVARRAGQQAPRRSAPGLGKRPAPR